MRRHSGDPSDRLALVESHCGKRTGVSASVLFARGLHHRATGDLAAALTTLDAAIEDSNASDLRDLTDDISISRAAVVAMGGDIQAAIKIVGAISQKRSDVLGTRARAQHGGFLTFNGDWVLAEEVLSGVGTQLDAMGEVESSALAHGNLDWALVQLGKIDRAVGELQKARELWDSIDALANEVTPHLAIAYSLKGSTMAVFKRCRR